MAYMNPNDALDILFTQLQNRLNSTEVAPCEHLNPKCGPHTCLSSAWGYTGANRPRFTYAPEAAAFVNKHFCAPCKASWYVAVARNLMFGIVS